MSANVSLTTETFGVLADKEGRSIPVEKFIWQTRAGLRICVLNLDAAIVELWVPGSDRVPVNILLAPDTLQEFLQLDPNLICGAYFVAPECLGPAEKPNEERVQAMVSDRIWQPFVDGTRLHLSRQLDAGRRNTLTSVTISVEPSNVVHIHYQAYGSGKDVRVSHRWLLNLGGRDGGPTATHQHVVQINANMLIDGKRTLRTVASNLADFRIAQHLGVSIFGASRASELAQNYLLNSAALDGYSLRLIHDPSGRAMELYCDFPWLRFTTLDDLPEGQGAPCYHPHCALRRLSLLFDLNRFITSIVDVIEGGKEKRVPTDKHQAPCTGGRFVKHSGLLVHPKYIEFPVPGATATEAITEKLARSIPRPTLFNANVRLKFGLCHTRHDHHQQSDGPINHKPN
ncbi:uncharacterized protein LOC118456152 [Anopheles albimanus]|uniref:Uncharacterized protein n=1 Tax=Anopheles albimanus TaxID=7167 RepID=A0A182F4X8_ANOAL|nr:uncharacterized protein LOC118456152 [Anopheles albimanus]